MLNSRKQFEIALLSLTDEAFGGLVLACYQSVLKKPMPWPDGLGGYTPESQESIKRVYDAATNFVTNNGK